jgi:hypothetical protein
VAKIIKQVVHEWSTVGGMILKEISEILGENHAQMPTYLTTNPTFQWPWIYLTTNPTFQWPWIEPRPPR